MKKRIFSIVLIIISIIMATLFDFGIILTLNIDKNIGIILLLLSLIFMYIYGIIVEKQNQDINNK